MAAKEAIYKIKTMKFKANAGVTAAARSARNGVDFARTSTYYREKPGQREVAVQQAIVTGMNRVNEARRTRSEVYGVGRQAIAELGKQVPASPARKRRAKAAKRAKNSVNGSLVVRDTYAAGFTVDPSLLGA